MGLFTGACVDNTKRVCLQALVWAIQNGSAAKWVSLPVLVGVAVTRRSVGARRRGPHFCALLGSARPSLQLTEA